MVSTDSDAEGAIRSPAAHGFTRAGRAVAVSWLAAVSMLALAAVVSYLGSMFIAASFPDRPRPRDLLFETLPHWDAMRYVTDLAVLAALILLLVYVVRYERDRLPGTVTAFAVFYILRAAIMVLTPLALAHGDGEYFALLPIVQNGDLSGHAGAALLCFLLIDPDKKPGLRRVVLAFAVIEWLALVTSRSHYSIDVVSGMLLAYFVWREWRDGTFFAPLKRLFVA